MGKFAPRRELLQVRGDDMPGEEVADVVPEKEAKKVLEKSDKKDIRQRLSVALRTMQPEGFTSPQIVNINAKVSKISESANKDLITEAEAGRRIGNHELLFEIAKCLGYDESKRSLENQHKKSEAVETSNSLCDNRETQVLLIKSFIKKIWWRRKNRLYLQS